ncbi:CGNR zinc finger domain-containing protein [Amycolatopsis sp. K13G38]|uniref:CGNR zinc finger domain-containing protein n=1 Tax=Amycolatopsis acididurans TaxID=2724524 RepID=A0ABX1IYB9_9PSEU|nr:CGNR zinc finger domain-containing protein [Amycolatopsis acididurans]NKQ52151.1 CGNR zinc finger domain-containing protein [Amycolatopsis acididurans]
MHFNPYGGLAAQVAVGLVNLGTAPAAAVTARARAAGMLIDDLSERDATGVADWTRRLRAVFAASDVDIRVDLVNELLADSACQPHISRHDGKAPHLHYAEERADTAARLRAYTAGGLAHLLCEDPARMGVCGRDGCDVVYVDTSRNGRRRFCSTRCATRVHVADHRARLK